MSSRDEKTVIKNETMDDTDESSRQSDTSHSTSSSSNLHTKRSSSNQLPQDPVLDSAAYKTVNLVAPNGLPSDQYSIAHGKREICLSIISVRSNADPSAFTGHLIRSDLAHAQLSYADPMVYYVDNTTDILQPNYSHLQQGKLITRLYLSSDSAFSSD